MNILRIFTYNNGLEIVEKTKDAIFLGLFYLVPGAYINNNKQLIKDKFNNKISFKYLIAILIFIIISIIEMMVISQE